MFEDVFLPYSNQLIRSKVFFFEKVFTTKERDSILRNTFAFKVQTKTDLNGALCYKVDKQA